MTDVIKRDILVLTTAYGPARPHAHLVEILSGELSRRGHRIRIGAIDWDGRSGGPAKRYSDDNGCEVIQTPVRSIGMFGRLGRLASRWGLSSLSHRRAVASAFGDRRYDLLLVMTPMVPLHATVRWALRRTRLSYAYVTDFFPIQHVNAGLLPHSLKGFALSAEAALLRSCSTIGTMSPLGVAFLEKHFSLGSKTRVETLRLWSESRQPRTDRTAATREALGIPIDRVVALFGGQLTTGRGVEDLVTVARLAEKILPEFLFLFVGDGPLASEVESAAGRTDSNVKFVKTIPREQYLDVVAAADVGLVATTDAHAAPVFPSKTIDYLRLGLPIVGTVEGLSDYGDFLVENDVGYASRAGDPEAFLENLAHLVRTPGRLQAMRSAAIVAFDRYFDVRSAADQILSHLDGSAAKEVFGSTNKITL